MFNALRNLFRPKATIILDANVAVAQLAAAIDAMPRGIPPKGKRWCLGLDKTWSLVDIPKPRHKRANRRVLLASGNTTLGRGGRKALRAVKSKQKAR